jgi:DNA-binding MarR family transcriptional regulator
MNGHSPAQTLPDEGLQQGIVSGIRLLARLARVAEQTCQSEQLSLPQYRLLVAASSGAERASDLARAVGVTRPTLTALVDGLEEGGKLRRVRLATDRRGVRLEVTFAGQEAMARVERAMAVRFGGLIQGDPNEILPALKDIVAGIGASLDREGRVAIASS